MKTFDRLISNLGNAFEYISSNYFLFNSADHFLNGFVRHSIVTDLIDQVPGRVLTVSWNTNYASYGNTIKPSQVYFLNVLEFSFKSL